MFAVYKLRADHVLDFAAEELKKYLRMMMPEAGDVAISYDPQADTGFRLGLLEDFGIPFEGEDPDLDDVIHVDTDADGGILAGSNPRSVLFAVYRLLRCNGCRWLYPGVDGEYIPVRDLAPTKYHKLADHRIRGHCNEGAESQQCMLETIDFYAKQEINVYMLEFDNPFYYYNNYYNHTHNQENRPPEPVSYDQVKQWKRQCEVEISKRGLQFHDMGHGWTADPFGFDSTDGWVVTKQELKEEQKQWLALVSGKRQFYKGVPLNTNLCMSNPQVRTKIAESVVNYALTHQNVDVLHVWLADGNRNHCECEACREMIPSDFYVMILNEIDEKLTSLNLKVRIGFVVYYDTLFAPTTEKLRNPERFCMNFCPITRFYTNSITEDSVIPEPPAYVRNDWQRPGTTEANVSHLKSWKQMYPGLSLGYEYHYWRQQYHDPGLMYISRRIYEDVRSLKLMGLNGYVEDGSQRSFFPNGFHICIYAEALMNRDCDYEGVREDYFRHIYGDAWKEVLNYLQKVSDTVDFLYMSGQKSADRSRGMHYNPDHGLQLAKIKEVAQEGRRIALAHMSMPTRPQTVSMRLLLRHAEYIEGFAACMAEKAGGDDEAAFRVFEEFRKSFGQYEFELERYFDHGLAFSCLRLDVKRPTVILIGGQ